MTKNTIPIKTLKENENIEGTPKSVTLKALGPSSLLGNPNDNSIVLYLQYRKTAFLFTSDIGQEKQRELIRKYKNLRRANCVQVPHHGGPISAEFAEAFPRAIFVISTGPNKWGIPQPDEINKLRGKVLRTDENGIIVVESNGNRVNVVTEK